MLRPEEDNITRFVCMSADTDVDGRPYMELVHILIRYILILTEQIGMLRL